MQLTQSDAKIKGVVTINKAIKINTFLVQYINSRKKNKNEMINIFEK